MPVSNAYVEQPIESRTGFLLKKTLSLSVIVLGLFFGILGVGTVADMPVFSGQFILDWPRVSTFASMAFVTLIGTIIAMRKPRFAGLLFLFAAPIIAASFVWWISGGRVSEDVPFRDMVLAFFGASLPFVVFGMFWFFTSRAGWPVVLASQTVVGSVFVLCLFSGLFVALYLRVNGWGGCSQNPPIVAPQYPDQAVFTAKALMVSHGFAPLRHVLGSWSLLRVEHKFWGVPSWAGFVIFREELPKKYVDEYFIDARRSQGLLMHFLPVLEFRMCSRTQPLQHAAVDLRLLQQGSQTSDVRIMGQVFDGEYVINKPVQGVKLWITGPARKIAAITDAQGMYDLGGLPAGHYTIQVDPTFLHNLYPHIQEADLKSGQIWNPFLITDFHGAYAP